MKTKHNQLAINKSLDSKLNTKYKDNSQVSDKGRQQDSPKSPNKKRENERITEQ